jgi:hypothetical protein
VGERETAEAAPAREGASGAIAWISRACADLGQNGQHRTAHLGVRCARKSSCDKDGLRY